MVLRVAASSDADAMAIRDHLLPSVREHGILEDTASKDSTLRRIVFESAPWRLLHWTPFNALDASEAASPGYRRALERQQAQSTLPYGLDVWHEGAHVLSLSWADAGEFAVRSFVRGPWEAAALAW